MSNIRRDKVNAVYNKTYAVIQNADMHKRFKDIRQYVLADESITMDEKMEVMKRFDGDYDYFRVVQDDGDRRICENCQESCLAILYCEYCIRKYLEKNFPNWTSGNDTIDNL